MYEVSPIISYVVFYQTFEGGVALDFSLIHSEANSKMLKYFSQQFGFSILAVFLVQIFHG